jgi:hypothetical protein
VCHLLTKTAHLPRQARDRYNKPKVSLSQYNEHTRIRTTCFSALDLKNITKLSEQMWACGSDFQYQNADHWFHQLDKLIHYVNLNASKGTYAHRWSLIVICSYAEILCQCFYVRFILSCMNESENDRVWSAKTDSGRTQDTVFRETSVCPFSGGPVVAFYSTPSHYTDAKNAATKKAGVDWEVRGDDIFPLGDNPHAYWSGYFTSRPGLKRQVRFASNFLSAARQMEVISGTTAAEVDHPTTRPSPPVVRNIICLRFC